MSEHDCTYKLTGDELFRNGDTALPFSLYDFWQFSFSNISDDYCLELLAEFIATKAFDKDLSIRQSGIFDYDFLYNGKRIKLQYSSDPFDYTSDNELNIDIIILCYYTSEVRNVGSFLDVSKWRFLIHQSNAKIITSLVSFYNLKDALDDICKNELT